MNSINPRHFVDDQFPHALRPYEVTLDGPPLEDTEVNFEAIELLKEEVERYRRDHGGQR